MITAAEEQLTKRSSAELHWSWTLDRSVVGETMPDAIQVRETVFTRESGTNRYTLSIGKTVVGEIVVVSLADEIKQAVAPMTHNGLTLRCILCGSPLDVDGLCINPDCEKYN